MLIDKIDIHPFYSLIDQSANGQMTRATTVELSWSESGWKKMMALLDNRVDELIDSGYRVIGYLLCL